MKNWIKHSKEKLVEELWEAEPKIKGILKNSKHVEEARFIMFDYLNQLERDLFNMSPTPISSISTSSRSATPRNASVSFPMSCGRRMNP